MLNRPQVGSQVSVVVRDLTKMKPVFVPLWDRYTAESPDTVTYTGTVIKPDHWLASEEFNLTTNQSHFPIRTINLKHVVSIDGAALDHSSKEKIEYKTIKGSKGNEYTVVVKDGIAESCTCPAFQFRGGRCKHLLIAMGQPVPTPDKPRKVTGRKKAPVKTAARKVTKLERARELYNTTNGDRKTTIKLFMDELNMSEAGASTYHYNIKKSLESGSNC